MMLDHIYAAQVIHELREKEFHKKPSYLYQKQDKSSTQIICKLPFTSNLSQCQCH
ncbi:hypothetical protein LS684_11490 [Cytobacillus spongiae]|uniref:hypothetical protein n=1 Tax=Cytobacillus spongiae TaxID=2901381 RepID=UPI001F43A12C|nr:hypothetical protein [Cytobacillus spongiae]UII54310.1 hypothetical protein LS684_11490 [Cytobacillus spongiae]